MAPSRAPDERARPERHAPVEARAEARRDGERRVGRDVVREEIERVEAVEKVRVEQEPVRAVDLAARDVDGHALALAVLPAHAAAVQRARPARQVRLVGAGLARPHDERLRGALEPAGRKSVDAPAVLRLEGDHELGRDAAAVERRVARRAGLDDEDLAEAQARDAARAGFVFERGHGAGVVARGRAVADGHARERRGPEVRLVPRRHVDGVGAAGEEVRRGARREEVRLRDDARRDGGLPALGNGAAPVERVGREAGRIGVGREVLPARRDVDRLRGSGVDVEGEARGVARLLAREVGEARVLARGAPPHAGAERARDVERGLRERRGAGRAEARRRRHGGVQGHRGARVAGRGEERDGRRGRGRRVERRENRGHLAQNVARDHRARAPRVQHARRSFRQDAGRPLEVDADERERALRTRRPVEEARDRGPEAGHDGQNGVEALGGVRQDERPVGIALHGAHEHRAARHHAAHDERGAGDGAAVRADDAREGRDHGGPERGRRRGGRTPRQRRGHEAGEQGGGRADRSRHGNPRSAYLPPVFRTASTLLRRPLRGWPEPSPGRTSGSCSPWTGSP